MPVDNILVVEEVNEVSAERSNHEQAHCFWFCMVHMGTLPGNCYRYASFQMKNAPSGLLSDIFDALVLLAFATVWGLNFLAPPAESYWLDILIGTLLWALGDFCWNTLSIPSLRYQVRYQQEHYWASLEVGPGG